MSRCHSCIAKKKTQFSTYNGAESGENINETYKPQINHKKTENTSHQITRTWIRLKI